MPHLPLPGLVLCSIFAGLIASCTRPASAPQDTTVATPVLTRTLAATTSVHTPGFTVPLPTKTPAVTSPPSPVAYTPTAARVAATSTQSNAELPLEVPIITLPLDGPIDDSQAEISGMDWYEDKLVLLPQYPERFGEGDAGAVFVLEKDDILAYLAGESSDPLQPRPIPFISSGLANRIAGYEGFEAIAFAGDRVYLTVESSPQGMLGYLVAGYVGGDLEFISLEAGSRLPIQPQTDIANFSDEAIVIFGNRLVTVYEANGRLVNASPVVHLFDASPQARDMLPFTNIEYRLTDATRIDDFGRFWMPNTFFIGDIQLMTLDDPIADQYGKGVTHSQVIIVERLLEFQFSEQGIVRSDSSPILLQLAEDGMTRNWEAIARLDDMGFLIATDEHPETILAFVAAPP